MLDDTTEKWMKMGVIWMKNGQIDEFLATRIFFLGPNFARNRLEVKKIRFLAKFRQ